MAPFVRPEFGALSVACAAWWAWRQPPQQWIRLGILMGLAALPWIVLLGLYAGSIVPTSMGTKAAFLADRCMGPLVKGTMLIWGAGRWLLYVGVLGIGVFGFRRAGFPRLCGVVLTVAILVYVTGLPSHFPRYHEQRYLYAWTPLLLIGFLALLTTPRQRTLGITLALASTVVLHVTRPYTELTTWLGLYPGELLSLRSFLSTQVPTGSRLMVLDAGYVVFATDYPLIDMVGLKSPSIPGRVRTKR